MSQDIPASLSIVGATPVPSGLSRAEEQFLALAANADIADGYRLIQDKALLLGMPFLITGIHVQDGIPRKVAKNETEPTNYVSLECMIGTRHMISRAVELGTLSENTARRMDPGEQIVFNDGSTGICRAIVSYLTDKQYIEIPDGPVGGEAGESRYDLYWRNWTLKYYKAVTDDRISFPAALMCARGLRFSEYDSDAGPAKTFYIG